MLETFVSEFLGATLLEQFAAIISLIAIFLATRQVLLSWPLDIISSALYALVFFNSRLYSDAMLQVIFIGMSFYGWYKWKTGNSFPSTKSGQKEQDKSYLQSTVLKESTPIFNGLSVRNIGKYELFYCILFTAVYTVLAGCLLAHFTAASLPFLDSFCTAMSISATYLAAGKVLESWHIWILTDCIYVGLFISKHLYPTAILYFVLIILAIYGLYTWKQSESAKRKKLPAYN